MSAPIIPLSESAKEPDMFYGKSVESHDYLVHFECESLELNGQRSTATYESEGSGTKVTY